jgi:uncharacterized protein with FMN-binding domain
MRRSPIVLSATAAGTAGILAFHAHAPSVTPASTASATATPAATATATGSSGSASAVSGAATGDAVSTQYGPAQVRVTVENGRITQVEAVQLQADDPRSAQISAYAAPILQQEVLQAQSADIDAVSGATFTSASYAQSLQSALDKLGYEAPDGAQATLQVPSGGGHGF